jgi:hypothetical protein
MNSRAAQLGKIAEFNTKQSCHIEPAAKRDMSRKQSRRHELSDGDTQPLGPLQTFLRKSQQTDWGKSS